jgi:transcriptional regulator with XRE-family HTH domain
MDKQTWGAQLRQARLARGLKLGTIGRRLMMNPNYISRIERGKHLPGLRTLAQLAEEVGLRVALVATDNESEVER